MINFLLITISVSSVTSLNIFVFFLRSNELSLELEFGVLSKEMTSSLY